MKLKYILLTLCLIASFNLSARDIQIVTSVTTKITLNEAVDFHLTDKETPITGEGEVNLASEDAWLYFNSIKPSVVLSELKDRIKINGEALDSGNNARIGIYGHGAVIIPHGKDYQPLETYTERNYEGPAVRYSTNRYYSNNPPSYPPDIPDNPENKSKWDYYRNYQALCVPLEQDNSIRSFRLKKGYMATFANEPDGLGYSRVFIADKEDLLVPEFPELLDKKVSFVRVIKWEQVSKKGWVGSIDKNQPEGLKYVREQCDKTESTWFYNWSPTTTWTDNPAVTSPNCNQEFVPHKWGVGGNLNEMLSAVNAPNLLGYNEPDDANQANVSVETALKDWPSLMQTGLRLGSPAIAKSNNPSAWLYRFMDECNKKNYRVDFIAIHCYWGGKTPQEWYNELKAIYDKTKRPIWITEWNNGANWTKEPWPSGDAAKRAKQLNDLTGILEVMDTTSFIERYSIYNWVEEYRAIIEFGSSNPNRGKLTPAGEYYAANNSEIAYNGLHDFVPVWTIREAPELSIGYDKGHNKVELSWSDYNKELITEFIVEQSSDGITFNEEAKTIPTAGINRYMLSPLNSEEARGGSVYYRIRSKAYNQAEKLSNVVQYNLVENEQNNPVITNMKIKKEPSVYVLSKSSEKKPVILLGTPTFRNQQPLVAQALNVSGHAFEIKLDNWAYMGDPVILNPDTIALMALPDQGTFNLGEITLKAGSLCDVGQEWKPVAFESPFDQVPVVIASRTTRNNNCAASVRVRNVTETGFEIKLQYEKARTSLFTGEDVHFIAATPGQGVYKKKKIQVGRSSEAVVGDYYNPATINFGETFRNPAFFGFMQTESDDITAALRIKERGLNYATLFKEREKSTSSAVVSKEILGWLIIETDENNSSEINEKRYPEMLINYNPQTKKVSLSGNGLMTNADIYSITGQLLKSKKSVYELDLDDLQTGIYLLKVDKRCVKIIIG